MKGEGRAAHRLREAAVPTPIPPGTGLSPHLPVDNIYHPSHFLYTCGRNDGNAEWGVSGVRANRLDENDRKTQN